MDHTFAKNKEAESCALYLARFNINVPDEVLSIAEDFYLPAKGAAAEFSSFKFQANRHQVGLRVNFDDAFIESIAKRYPKGKLPLLFSAPTQENFDKALAQVLLDINPGSTPGWPLNSAYKTVSDITGDPSALMWLYNVSWDMFQYLMTHNITTMSSTEVLRELGVVNHLFIKDELHGADKVRTGRFRLIFSVPLLVNLMERLACSFQNKEEVLHWADIPSKIGIGFTDEMSQQISDYVRMKKLVNSTDVSGWDWTVIGDLIDADCKVRVKLTEGFEGHNNFKIFMENVNHFMTCKVIGLSDGTLLAQTFKGIVPSGSYRTSSSNSRIRLMARNFLFEDKEAATVGDDCLEGAYGETNPWEAYASLGLILKVSQPCHPDDFEFCSKRFINGKPQPVDPLKLILRYFVTQGYLDTQVHHSVYDELRNCDQQFRDLLWLSGELL